jgi:hypothetical protein
MEKTAVIKFITKNGKTYGYLGKDLDVILPKHDAMQGNIEYMRGVAYGLTFAISYYEDEYIERAEIEEVE